MPKKTLTISTDPKLSGSKKGVAKISAASQLGDTPPPLPPSPPPGLNREGSSNNIGDTTSSPLTGVPPPPSATAAFTKQPEKVKHSLPGLRLGGVSQPQAPWDQTQQQPTPSEPWPFQSPSGGAFGGNVAGAGGIHFDGHGGLMFGGGPPAKSNEPYLRSSPVTASDGRFNQQANFEHHQAPQQFPSSEHQHQHHQQRQEQVQPQGMPMTNGGGGFSGRMPPAFQQSNAHNGRAKFQNHQTRRSGNQRSQEEQQQQQLPGGHNLGGQQQQYQVQPPTMVAQGPRDQRHHQPHQPQFGGPLSQPPYTEQQHRSGNAPFLLMPGGTPSDVYHQPTSVTMQPPPPQNVAPAQRDPNLYLEGFVAAMSAVQRQTAEFLANASKPPGTAGGGLPVFSGESSAYPPAQPVNATTPSDVSQADDEGEDPSLEAPRFLPNTKANRETKVTVDGQQIAILSVLPNRATDLLLENPSRLTGRYCKQQAPHSPYECTFIHLAEVEIEGEKLPVGSFAPGVAVEFMLTCRGLATARWCTDPSPHEVWSCRYLHKRRGSSRVKRTGMSDVEKQAMMEQHVKESKVGPGSDGSGKKKSDQDLVDAGASVTQEGVILAATGEELTHVTTVDGTHLAVQELQRNTGLSLLLANPNRPARVCHNMVPHPAPTCMFLHLASVRMEGGGNLPGAEVDDQTGEARIALDRLVPNVAIDYLLRHPSAVGRRCQVTIPHDVSLCTYVHLLPQPPKRESPEMEEQQRHLDAHGVPMETEEEYHHRLGQYRQQPCPCCAEPLDPESLRVRGWCQGCGVEWQMSTKYGNAPRMVLGAPSLMDRFLPEHSNPTSRHSHSNHSHETRSSSNSHNGGFAGRMEGWYENELQQKPEYYTQEVQYQEGPHFGQHPASSEFPVEQGGGYAPFAAEHAYFNGNEN